MLRVELFDNKIDKEDKYKEGGGLLGSPPRSIASINSITENADFIQFE